MLQQYYVSKIPTIYNKSCFKYCRSLQGPSINAPDQCPVVVLGTVDYQLNDSRIICRYIIEPMEIQENFTREKGKLKEIVRWVSQLYWPQRALTTVSSASYVNGWALWYKCIHLPWWCYSDWIMLYIWSDYNTISANIYVFLPSQTNCSAHKTFLDINDKSIRKL